MLGAGLSRAAVARGLGRQVGLRGYAAVALRGRPVERHVPKEPRSTAEQAMAAAEDLGPPAVCDDIPIPFKPYKEEFDRQNAIFNKVLAVCTVIFVASVSYGLFFNIYGGRGPLGHGLPKAYVERSPRPDYAKLRD